MTHKAYSKLLDTLVNVVMTSVAKRKGDAIGHSTRSSSSSSSAVPVHSRVVGIRYGHGGVKVKTTPLWIPVDKKYIQNTLDGRRIPFANKQRRDDWVLTMYGDQRGRQLIRKHGGKA